MAIENELVRVVNGFIPSRMKDKLDEFYGENEGLTLAEIELTSETEIFDLPEWIGKEVTGDNRYYNSQLSKIPFKNWSNENDL